MHDLHIKLNQLENNVKSLIRKLNEANHANETLQNEKNLRVSKRIVRGFIFGLNAVSVRCSVDDLSMALRNHLKQAP